MGGFVARRLLQALATVALAVFVLFLALEMVPGDPVRALFGFQAPPPDVYEAIRRQFHLDEPLLQQYLLFMGDLLQGDLGRAFPRDPFGRAADGLPIAPMLAAALPVSLRVLGAAFVLMVIGGVAAGVAGALTTRRWLVTAIHGGAVLLVSVPVLVLGFSLQSFLADWSGPFPPAGGTQTWRGYVLPVLAIALPSAAYLSLVARSELLSVLREPFVTAARGRALPPRRIVGVHALRVAMVEVVVFAGAHLSQLIAGLVVVEGVFDLPGVGGLMLSAIIGQDRSLLLVLVVLTIGAVTILSALVDLLHGVLDPRVEQP